MKPVVAGGLFLLVLFSPVAQAQVTVADAGNAMCPVSGDKVSGKDFAELEGKKYGLCCAMCADKFTNNPEKYLAGMETTESHEGHEHHDHPM